ncbi:hypothetical protein ABBQ32_011215 [Trebouxia sp. C0010 RCD-2024]
MVTHAKVTAAFRRLVALVARCFYAGECPPKTAEEIAAPVSAKTKQQGTTHGLGIILLDALCGKDQQDRPIEWINEEALAESLHLHIKQVRKALRWLEQEQILAREHRAESARSRKKQAAAEAAAGRSTVTGEAVDGDMEGGLKAEVISWCCIDWPSFNNVIRLRLRKVQDALKDQATDRHTIQKYRCPRCERSYTSLDIASFPIREFGFQCGECSEEGYDVSLHESFHSQDGAMIDVKEKDQRVAAAKQMLRAFEGELKPLLEQLKKLEGIPVPDFGPLDDWAANRNAEMQRRARRAAGGGMGQRERREGELDGIDQDFDETQVEVNLAGPDAGTAEGSETLPGKALPPWLLRQGITSTSSARGGQAGTPLLQAGVGASGGAVTSGEAILSEEEDQKRIEEEYLKQYMAQVALVQQRQAQARAGTLDGPGQQELKDIETDLAIAKAEVDAAEEEEAGPAKRIKMEGGWSGQPDAAPPAGTHIKQESSAAAPDDGVPLQAVKQGTLLLDALNGVDGGDWEDVEIKAAPDEVKPEAVGTTALADDDEWEDV